MYSFDAEVWVYPGTAAWYFVTLPVDIAQDITDNFGQLKRGFGSLPVNVNIGNTSWKTSIFTDTKSNSYMLPLKTAVRRAESIKAGDAVQIKLDVVV